jgi:hypothetical protein
MIRHFGKVEFDIFAFGNLDFDIFDNFAPKVAGGLQMRRDVKRHCKCVVVSNRVARFFLAHDTKNQKKCTK